MKSLKPILTASLLCFALSAQAQDGMQAPPAKERIAARMDRMASRLEIKPSQQKAWDEYAKSVESFAENRPKMPGENANAVEIAKFRERMAKEASEKFSRIAAATEKLRDALDANQREVLDRMARNSMHRPGMGRETRQNDGGGQRR